MAKLWIIAAVAVVYVTTVRARRNEDGRYGLLERSDFSSGRDQDLWRQHGAPKVGLYGTARDIVAADGSRYNRRNDITDPSYMPTDFVASSFDRPRKAFDGLHNHPNRNRYSALSRHSEAKHEDYYKSNHIVQQDINSPSDDLTPQFSNHNVKASRSNSNGPSILLARSVRSVPIQSNLKPFPRNPSLRPIPPDPNLRPITPDPNVQPIPSDPNLKPIPSDPNLRPIPSDPNLHPIPSDPNVWPIPSDPNLRPIPSDPNLRPIPSDPNLRPITPDPNVRPITSDPSLKPIN